MSKELSKHEFLKRYLENEKALERKRKKKAKPLKPKANVPCLKIIDQDIDLKSIDFGDKIEVEDDDEAPVVAEVIDERPVEIKVKELYESSRWKKISNDEFFQSNSAALSDSRESKSRRESCKEHLSPERKDFASSAQTSSKRARHDSDSDISPPRSQGRTVKKKQDSDNNISPVRNQKRRSDATPPQTHKQSKNISRQNSDSDISPPRTHKKTRNINRQNSNSDISPSRTHKQSGKINRWNSNSDISRPRAEVSSKSIKWSSNSGRHDSNSDISPPRHHISSKTDSRLKNKANRHDSDSDISPPRHQIVNNSNSQMKNLPKWHDSDSDDAPSQYRNRSPLKLKSNRNRSESWKVSDCDISPPRSPSKLSASKSKSKKLDKTLSGLNVGLQNSQTLKQEVQELRKREKNQLNMLDDEISGRNADTIIRDRKTGMKRDLIKEQEAKTEENKKAKEYEQKYNKWGKGIEQTQDKVEKFKDDLYEMSKPLARYRDDEDLDERLKSVIHDEDPMSAYIKKKKQKVAPSVPVYSGPPAPPNRFGIMPGYRWDGVDRSNGFEKKYFEKINSTKAIQDEAYLWSIQDM